MAVEKVPPDGGYGWVVTLAFALNNVVVLPLIAGFGLIFQEAFDDTGISATQGTLVIVLNHSIGMFFSFFGGPLLKRFGYRKVAVLGAIFISAGLILTSQCTSFWQFIVSYSIINSMGVASVMSAFTLAINSFFKEKRSRAIGVGMSITGLGAILMPLLMSLLMSTYGWRYAVLILGAICLHSLMAACLLRPAKWYMVVPGTTEETVPLKETEVQLINDSLTGSSKNGVPSLPSELEMKNGALPAKSVSMRSLYSSASLQARNAISHPDVRNKSAETSLTESRYKWWESQEINLGSSINIFNEEAKKVKEAEPKIEVKKEPQTIAQKIIAFFDLTLLKDPIFVNMMFGMSIAACVETNFSLLFPIILKDLMMFSTGDIAKLMAVVGLSDTMFRLVAPFLGEWVKKPPRVMYVWALIMIVIIRTVMLYTSSFLGMCFVTLAIGVTKGVRTVYMNVIIPSYVPLDRLAFASGIQMFFNGITIFTIGSLLGRIREKSGSYIMPIIVLNIVTMITVVLWTGEFIYFKVKNRDKADVETN